MKVRSSSSVWVQIMKMSLMKRHQVCGWCGARVTASVSSLARDRLACDGAMRVPMAVPCVWMRAYTTSCVLWLDFSTDITVEAYIRDERERGEEGDPSNLRGIGKLVVIPDLMQGSLSVSTF